MRSRSGIRRGAVEGFVNESFFAFEAEKRERIISAAVNEFAERGYELANTNHIAEQAKISVGSLFHYFDTKENLFSHRAVRFHDHRVLRGEGGKR